MDQKTSVWDTSQDKIQQPRPPLSPFLSDPTDDDFEETGCFVGSTAVPLGAIASPDWA